MPGKNFFFTTFVDPVSGPPKPAGQRVSVDLPGTAPGSDTLIPKSVYRHSYTKVTPTI